MSAPARRPALLRPLGGRATDRGQIGYAALLLAVLVVVYWTLQPHVFQSAPQLNSFLNEGIVIALAAMGTTVVIIAGGFDLSVGSALSLVNVIVATQVGESTGSQLLAILIGLGVGLGIGLVNGLLVAVLRIRAIVATLATFFLWSGLALLVLSQPGGSVPPQFSVYFTGYYGLLPAGLVVLLVALAVWLLLARTTLGRHIYALGGNAAAARAHGIDTRRTELSAYVIAGGFYGLAGVFLTAQSASGDPNIGAPLLLTVYAALVVGGTPLGGGRGSAVSGLIGAFVLVLISRVLFAFGASSFYKSILYGAVLVLAVAISQIRLDTIRAALRRNRSAYDEQTAGVPA
ncbi:MAG: ABC transporter permease [Actinomycetota bacterium]|nr:ABC transporter permease [Actinomycetota bacterium]